MKKLFAILLSMLLLCGMIPFAAVSAAGDYYIELVADAEEVDAGDEITVEVSLYGHESVGLIGAQLELGFDPAVFELVTYYDEDEEMWMPPIEVGPKFSASSNKYIMFPPIDEETGYMERCLVQFLRATASASQAVKTNLFYTVTFKVKDDAPSGNYTIDIINYEKTNIFCHGNVVNDYTWEPITITVNGSEPAGCEHEYEYDCSKNCSKCGEETRPEAAHEFFNDCETVCMICYQEVREASHNVIHVEAKAPTCTAGGNIEYWYCDACGAAWLNAECTLPTNLRAVNLPMAEHTYFDDCSAICDVCGYEREVSHNIIHVAPVAATCTTDGNIEYWYCDACGAAWLDAECTLNTNLRSVILPASCSYNAVRTPAKDATCYEPGNVEYWYCANCDMYYLDEACAFVTNAKSVVTPISHNIIHVAPVAATCTTDGNIEYWYCDICGQAWLDEYCHQNTNLKSVILPASCSYNAEHVEAKEANCFEPGNVEYWYCANCDVYYADAACAIVTNAKNVIIPITHKIEYVAPVAATCTTDGNIEYWYCTECGAAWLDELCHLPTNLKSVILPASCSYNAEHVEAKEANCFEPGNVEYWYCANCDVYYADAACAIVTNAKNVIIPITHNIIHVAPVAATCTTDGNIEYWYCDICGQAWLDEYCHQNTNLKSVILPASCSYGAEYVEAKAATCFEPGNVEYWYCANCDVYYADAACAIVTNAKNVIIPITHNIIHVAPVAATCTTDGNIEYWYCADCGAAWLDELCHLPTNLKSVILPASCSYNAVYTEAKAPTCAENGNTEYWYCANCDVYYADAACAMVTNSKNVIIPSLPHTYDDDMDVDCNVCGDIRVIKYEVKTFGGTSFMESNDGLSGLAFRFDLTDKIQGLAVKEGTLYAADYSNATVTPDSTGTYKLVKMGAKVSNGVQELDVAVTKVILSDTEAFYAIRIINIPEDKYDTVIECTPYFVYKDANGKNVTVYGETVSGSVNG